MKTNQSIRLLCVFACTAALAILGSGCATHEEHSFNEDFNQQLPTAPMYYVENVNSNRFTVTVLQGRPMASEERIIHVKRAASAVAEKEARARGWENWQLEYIRQGSQGWMFTAKADVTRKNAVEFQGKKP
jgi:hypothetical protein